MKRFKSRPSYRTSFFLMATFLAAIMNMGCESDVLNKENNDHLGENKELLSSERGCQADPSMPVNLCGNMRDGWIFCDDFESDEPLNNRYFEYHDNNNNFVVADSVGRSGGRGMRADFQSGVDSNGNLKFSFGKHEDEHAGRTAVNPDEIYYDIYWNIDLCHETGWVGGGGYKLSRSMTLLEGWKQGHIAHIWDGGDRQQYLKTDPASGIDENGQIVVTKYNDFDNLRWLGGKSGSAAIFHPDSVGRWYSIEARIKLNTPGETDGIFEFWIDGVLQASRNDYNWHGTFNKDPDNPGINAIFIENFWNNGAIANQTRYFDNFVVSTSRIGDLRE